jgi:hypothetical protein
MSVQTDACKQTHANSHMCAWCCGEVKGDPRSNHSCEGSLSSAGQGGGGGGGVKEKVVFAESAIIFP